MAYDTAPGHGLGQPATTTPAIATAPHNLEVEQALLGVLLYDNAAYERLTDSLQGRHFYEPFHARLYDSIESHVRKGQLAEPMLLGEEFKADPAFEELGGLRYLADLVDRAPPAVGVADYARTVQELATRRDLIRIGGELAASAHSGAKIEDVLSDAERSLHGAATVGVRAASFVRSGAAATAVLERLDTPDDHEGVGWGLEPMDKQLGAMLAGDLIVLGGRTSMGKSALASDLAVSIALQGKACIEVNGEMSVEQMTRRHLTSLAFTRCAFDAPGYSDIRKREISPSQRKMLENAAREFSELPVSMLKRTGLGLGALRSLVRRERSIWERKGIPLGALIVDHVGLIKADGGGRSRYEDQTAVSNGMKELADELGVPVIALAQLSRETEKRDNKRPILSDLRDSGAWEQDADVVIGIYRDAYYAAREPEPKDDGKPNSSNTWAEWDRRRRSKIIEAIVLKAREGECGTVELWGDMRTNAIRAAAPNDGGFL